MKKILATVMLTIVMLAAAGLAEEKTGGYHQRYNYLLTSPGAMGFGLYGLVNPAVLTYVHEPSLYFTWSEQDTALPSDEENTDGDDTDEEDGYWNDINRWAYISSLPNFGFGVMREEAGDASVTDFRLSLAGGTREVGFGLGYGWSSGDKDEFDRESIFSIGTLYRPFPYLSLGASGLFETSSSGKEGIAELAVRPFGNEKLSLFGDYSLQDGETFDEGFWSAGAAVEPLPGIRLAGRYFEDESFTVGIHFSFGYAGVTAQAHYDEESDHGYNTFGVRVGALDRNIFGKCPFRDKKYMKLDMKGPLKYQNYLMFDDSNTLARLLDYVEAAEKDASVGGIVINTSGMMINWEKLWEVRQKLAEFKETGKEVVIYIDNVDITGYHFASVADKVILDPIGTIMLQGYIFGHNYFKGALEKLGIGFDEWRFMKYKSAAEMLSRDSMSDAEEEQLLAILDDMYFTAKKEICDSRNITHEKFDNLVDDVTVFTPETAMEQGLADGLGHWEDVRKMLSDEDDEGDEEEKEELKKEHKQFVQPGMLDEFHLPTDDYWGERPKIAVIYALGVCAMDQGITARKLVKDVQSATRNDDIEAVVLRVDSPGGDALASDIVAEAVKKCTEKKPVIVSQGLVAASGGYWLSMYADQIVAAPTTITGSIGVIGGWLYDQGFKSKLGVTTDYVKIGEHADLGFGFRIPLLGMTLPDRNLTDKEQKRMKDTIISFYHDFVEKVAEGRNMDYEEIEKVAQGRVWSGIDGIEAGLVDLIGGLDTAVELARVKAEIPPDVKIDIIEYPEPDLFDTSILMPKLFGVKIKKQKEPLSQLIDIYLKNNGKPLPIMPSEYLELFLLSQSDRQN